MRAGPKAAIRVPPLDLGFLDGLDRAHRVMGFIERFCVTPRGHGAGEPLRLRVFQREFVTRAYAPGVRTAVLSLPRANGKTLLSAALALAELFDGPPSAEVVVVASDHRQANILLRLARRMVELSPELEARTHVHADRLYVPQHDATLMPLPAERGALQGYDPSLLVVDELHVVTREVWEAVVTASGKRPDSRTVAISTPAQDQDSAMWDLVEHGRAGTDPAFALAEYAAPDGCALDDRAAWRVANPALADPDPFLAEDALAAVMRTVREPSFRRLRLGQWVGSDEGSWLPWGAWQQCADEDREVPDGAPIVCGFDGSVGEDATALVAATVEEHPHVFVLGVWENPGRPGWRVPRAEVSATVDAAFERFDVRELACDPWHWRQELEQWAARHGEKVVTEFPTNSARRMGPAVDRAYTAVMQRAVTHDGHEALARHVGHAVAKPGSAGDLLVKDRKDSPRRIDAAVAAVIAVDRAAHHATRPRRSRRVHVFG